MATFKKFEDIEAWKHARELVQSVYNTTRGTAFAHDFGLRDQLQRATVSICSNIAEGFARRGNKEFVKFIWIARGSAAEVQSQLINACDIGYVNEETRQSLYNVANTISAMLYKLIVVITNSDHKDLSYTKV